MRELWLQISHTSAAKVYSLISGMVVLFLTARWLGPEGRGVVAAVTTWVSLFSTFGFLSLGQVALHLATERREENWLPSVFGSLMFIAALVTVSAWTVAGILHLWSNGGIFNHINGLLIALGFLSLPFIVWEQYGSSLLTATDRLSVYNRAQIIGRTVGILAVILLLWVGWGIAGVLLASLAAQVTVAAAGIRCLWAEASGCVRPNWATVKELLRGGLKLHFNAVGTYLFSSASILIIDHYRGKAETGQYQLAVQLLSATMIIPQSASMVLYSKMSQVGVNAVWPFQKRILLGMTALMIVGSGVAAVAAPFIINLLAGSGFAPSADIFRILLLASVGTVFSAVMAPQWIGRGLFWQAAAITLACGFSSVALAFWLVPKHGMLGAAWAFVATYALALGSNGAMGLWVECRTRAVGA